VEIPAAEPVQVIDPDADPVLGAATRGISMYRIYPVPPEKARSGLSSVMTPMTVPPPFPAEWVKMSARTLSWMPTRSVWSVPHEPDTRVSVIRSWLESSTQTAQGSLAESFTTASMSAWCDPPPDICIGPPEICVSLAKLIDESADWFQ
jgi:hypothetical protein